MTIEQLAQYCIGHSFRLSSRPELEAPFNQGAFTIATNGHILIRVPKHLDIESQSLPEIQPLFDALTHTKMISWNGGMLPFGSKECATCYGLGRMTECEGCEGSGMEDEWGDCDECNGSGEVPKQDGEFRCGECCGSGKVPEFTNVRLGTRYFFTTILNRVLLLPSLRIAIDGDPIKSCYFTFDGGDGLVMPCVQNEQTAESLYEIKVQEVEA